MRRTEEVADERLVNLQGFRRRARSNDTLPGENRHARRQSGQRIEIVRHHDDGKAQLLLQHADQLDEVVVLADRLSVFGRTFSPKWQAINAISMPKKKPLPMPIQTLASGTTRGNTSTKNL